METKPWGVRIYEMYQNKKQFPQLFVDIIDRTKDFKDRGVCPIDCRDLYPLKQYRLESVLVPGPNKAWKYLDRCYPQWKRHNRNIYKNIYSKKPAKKKTNKDKSE